MEPYLYENMTLQGGVNTRTNGRKLRDTEATSIINGDISSPGVRVKRSEPALFATLESAPKPITGMEPFVPSSSYIVATFNGKLWTVSSAGTGTSYTGATISDTSPSMMVRAADSVGTLCIWGIDSTNPPFKFDGTTLSTVTFTGQGALIVSPTAICSHMDRVWYAQSDFLYRSEVGDPATINDAAIRCHKGSGSTIIQIIADSFGHLLIFKGGASGLGSIHRLDVSSGAADPAGPIMIQDNIRLPSGRAILRSKVVEQADVLLLSGDGVRPLSFTFQDEVRGPELPISDPLKDYFDALNMVRLANSFAVMFNDELLLWVPYSGDATTPDTVLCDTFKVPKESVQQGWTVINMALMAGFSACEMTFGTQTSLFVGSNTGGTIYKAFSDQGTTYNYNEIGKRISFGNREGTPFKLIVVHDAGSSGEVTYNLIDDAGTTYNIGTSTLTGGNQTLPVTLPFTLTGVATTNGYHAGMDKVGSALPRSRDWRVQIICSGDPKILSYSLGVLVAPMRFDPQISNPTPTYSSAYAETISAAALTTY